MTVAKVQFTEEQLIAALFMRDGGAKVSEICVFLKTTPLTYSRHIEEFVKYGFEGYLKIRETPNEEELRFGQSQRNIQALITKNSILSELIQRGDIKVCKEFIRLYDHEDYKFFSRIDNKPIEKLVRELKESIIKRETSLHRFSVASLER